MKAHLAQLLLELPGARINGPQPGEPDAAPHILSLTLEGVRGEVLRNALEGEGIQREWAYALTRCDQWVELSPGDTVQAPDGTVFTVIPSGKSTSSPVNDMSLILLMDCESTRVLFTGDANVGRGPRAEILKVGHHGSRENTDEDVVKSVSPEVAVISVGKNNSYGHPAPEVVQLLEESGAKVYRTDECGAVVVRIGKWRYRVDTFLEAAQ